MPIKIEEPQFESLDESLPTHPSEGPITPFKNPIDLANSIKKEEEIFTPNDHAQIEKYAKHYGVDLDELAKNLEQNTLKRISGGASITNAKNDALEELLEQVANGTYKSAITNKTKKKIEDQVDDGVTEDDIGYVRNVLNTIPEIGNLSDNALRKIISTIIKKKGGK